MTRPPARILIAKAGLDGHDRGALMICLALRDAGCEVLYTGIRNTPSQIIATAIQEDVDDVGLSSLAGAHKALFPRIAEGLREAGAEDISLFAGGIIPKPDHQMLHDAGIKRLFHPGTSTTEISEFCIAEATARRAKPHPDDPKTLYGLSGKLTQIENESNGASVATAVDDPRIVGLTGPGGTGKSTMINSMITEIRSRGQKVGVICVDPSSVRSGGAFLGDRIRMQRHANEDGVFIRSVATRGAPGGVPPCVSPMAKALRDAGYDWVLVESVGTGQDQVEIRKHVGCLLVADAPGRGDVIQTTKSSAHEISDLVVVTRSDEGKSEEHAKNIRAMLRATRADEEVPVLVISGERGTGIDALIDHLESVPSAALKS